LVKISDAVCMDTKTWAYVLRCYRVGHD